MDTNTLDSQSPLHAPPPAAPSPEGAEHRRAYLEPALTMCGSVPAITGGSDIFGDMDT